MTTLERIKNVLNTDYTDTLKPVERASNLLFFLKWYKVDAFLAKNFRKGLFVTGPAIALILKDKMSDVGCCFAVTHEMVEKGRNTSGPILVYLPRDERRVIQHLKKEFPDRRILSFVTDIMPKILSDFSESIHSQAPALMLDTLDDQTQRKIHPILLLGSPGSEVSYLATLYRESGLGEISPYLGNLFASMWNMRGSFPLARYVKSIHEYHENKWPLSSFMYTDLLFFMLETGILKKHRFLRYLEQTNTRVIYYTMRDKVRQALYINYFRNRNFSSFWEIDTEARKNFKPSAIDPIGVFTTIMPSLIDDIETEKLITSFPNTLIVTHEDLVMAPKEVMANIANFSGRSVQFDPVTDWTVSIKKSMPDIEKHTAKIVRILIDRLGLHANASGSLVPLQSIVSQVTEDRLEGL